jgi:hypothetical protein
MLTGLCQSLYFILTRREGGPSYLLLYTLTCGRQLQRMSLDLGSVYFPLDCYLAMFTCLDRKPGVHSATPVFSRHMLISWKLLTKFHLIFNSVRVQLQHSLSVLLQYVSVSDYCDLVFIMPSPRLREPSSVGKLEYLLLLQRSL